MPWQEMSIVDRRREFAMVASLPGSNMAELCRRFGISRPTGYKWLRRSGEGESFEDRSRRPRSSPGRTAAATETAVLALREAHPCWGARKIAHLLSKEGLAPPAISTVHAILARHGLIEASSRTSASQRFEKPAPNLLWQMDFKGRVQIGEGRWCHPLTVLDDHSRFSLCLAACSNERTETVRPLLERTFRLYGLPDAFYVDNGPPWGGGVPGQWTPLGVFLLKLGVEVIHARPYHPQGRGKNERFHRTLKAEVFAARPFRDLDQVQKSFDNWRLLYNTKRPHQALGMEVPASRYRPSPRAFPVKPPRIEYDSGDILRRVAPSGSYVSFKNRLWRVPRAFAGEQVAIRPAERDGLYRICFGATHIASIDLKHPDQTAQEV